MAFLDLERLLTVPRRVVCHVWWVLGQMDKGGWLIGAVGSMCGSAEASVGVG